MYVLNRGSLKPNERPVQMAEILTNCLGVWYFTDFKKKKKLLSPVILKIKQKAQDLVGLFWILKDVCFTYGNIINP